MHTVYRNYSINHLHQDYLSNPPMFMKALNTRLNVPIHEATSLTTLTIDREQDCHFLPRWGLKGPLRTNTLFARARALAGGVYRCGGWKSTNKGNNGCRKPNTVAGTDIEWNV